MLDTHDADALESLEAHEGFRLIVGRVKTVIEDKRDELEVGDNAEANSERRGFLAACRMFLRLSEIMRGEVKE